MFRTIKFIVFGCVICLLSLLFFELVNGAFSINQLIKLSSFAVTIYAAYIIGYVMLYFINPLGAMIGGWLSGRKLLAVQLLNHTLIRQEGRFHWVKGRINLKDSVIMTLHDYKDIKPSKFYGFEYGGIILTIILLVIALIVFCVCDLNKLAHYVLLMFILLGIFELIKKIRVLVDKNKLRRNFNDAEHDFVNALKITEMYYENVPFESMPDGVFGDSPVVEGDNLYKIGNRLDYLIKLVVTGDYQKANELLREDGFKNLTGVYQLTYQAAYILLELMTTRRTEILNSLWTPQLRSFILNSSLLSPKFLPINYAYELLVNRDTDTAQKWAKTFESSKDKYVLQGWVETSESMFAKIHGIYVEETGEEIAEYGIEQFIIKEKTVNRKGLLFIQAIIGMAIAALIYSGI